MMLILRGEIPRPMRDFSETLSQAMLVGVMLVGGLGVWHVAHPLYIADILHPGVDTRPHEWRAYM